MQRGQVGTEHSLYLLKILTLNPIMRRKSDIQFMDILQNNCPELFKKVGAKKDCIKSKGVVLDQRKLKNMTVKCNA